MDFWDLFWLLLIYVPLIMMWGFTLLDIFRRDDIHGIAKAAWTLCIFVLPWLGVLIYLVVRPAGATSVERDLIEAQNRAFVEQYAPANHADQLATLADLHDRGKIDDAEFAQEKARVLSMMTAMS